MIFPFGKGTKAHVFQDSGKQAKRTAVKETKGSKT
jgi:hypothetical protein